MNDDFELSWDSVISQDAEEFPILPAGVYAYEIINMERGRYPGSEKMHACPSATLTIKVTGQDGTTGRVLDTLYLAKKAEWRLCQFFTSIGQRKKGEELAMNWNRVVGSTGQLELTVNEYTKKDGTKATNNRVGKYLPRPETTAVPSGF